MKKLITVLFLIIVFSCKKDDKYCWQCNRETTMPNSYSSLILQVCDMTFDERSDFERSNTYNTVNAKVTMTCKLK